MSRAILILAFLPGGFFVLAAVGVLSPPLRRAWADLAERIARSAVVAWWTVAARVRVWWTLRTARLTLVLYSRPTGACDQLVGSCATCGNDWYAFDPQLDLELCPHCDSEVL